MKCFKTYNCKCPICGAVNRHLDLEETNGMMECEKCGSVVNARSSIFSVNIPVLQPDQLSALLRTGGGTPCT